MDERPDEHLIPVIGTDPEALETFYRRNVRRVVSFAARRGERPDDVADLVASVFVAAIESAHRFDSRRGGAVPWLLGIAVHEHARLRRRRGREAAAMRRLAGRSLLEGDDYQRLEDQIDAARLAPEVRAALEALPPRERELLELVSLDGLDQHEAAAALGVRPGTARMRLSRGRRKLQRLLEPGRATDGADLRCSALLHEEA